MIDDSFFFSHAGGTKIHLRKWYDERQKEIKGVVVLVHGMAEHIGRYDEFAKFLIAKGYVVFGADHLGHGQSVSSDKELGYFCSKKPAEVLVLDVHTVVKIAEHDYPGSDVFILGHSMGSFVVRNYLCDYCDSVKAAVIVGTGSQSGIVLLGGKIITSVISFFRGGHYYSPFVEKMAFGHYLDRIENPVSGYDWLSEDKENVKSYLEDDRAGIDFTVNGYKTLFTLISRCQSKSRVEKMDKKKPILIISGKEDPVGDYGKGVAGLVSLYKKHGLCNVHCRLYDNMRHEILNETERHKVYDDVYKFILKKAGKEKRSEE